MVTLALIGAGIWGSNYIRVAKKSGFCRIKYIASRDYKKLVRFPDIDGIIIASPSSTHFGIAEFFLERNYNLLIEKPLVINVSNAQVLSNLYKKRKSTVMVGHIYLYSGAFEKFRELIPSLGRLRYLQFESGNWGPFRKDAGALWDWGPHDLSMCLSVMKKDPVSIACWSNSNNAPPEMVLMRLDFDSSISAFVSTGRLRMKKTRKAFVVGSNGSLLFDDRAIPKLVLVDHARNVRSYPAYDKEEPLKRQLIAFCDAIQQKRRRDENFFMGIRIVKLLDLLDRSLKNHGKTISITI